MIALSRGIAIAVSMAIHVGGAGLALTGTGHAQGRTSDAAIVEIDTVTLDPPPPVAAPAPRSNDDAVVPHMHMHPYPVPKDHDAHPHDPSLHHAEEASPSVAASPAPAVVSADEPALPRFTMRLDGRAATVAAPSSGASSGALSPEPSAALPLPASEASVQARLVASVPFVYPAGARSDEIEGDVSLELVLDTDGSVSSARVVRAAGHGFDEAALTAVRRYRFTSALRHGQAIRVRMPWTVQFRIR